MKMTRSIAAAILACACTAGHALTTLRLEPAAGFVNVDTPFLVRVLADIDAADEIIGFGFDLIAPPSVSLLGFAPGPGFADDPVYLAPLSDADGLRAASAGDLLLGPPVSGNNLLLGTLSLRASALGPVSISLAADDLSFFFTEGLIPLSIALSNFMPPVTPAAVNVTSAVPEPTTWVSLPIGAIVMFGFLRRVRPAVSSSTTATLALYDRPMLHASIFAALNALVSMKSRRGSTSSPISIVNTRSASIASSI